MELTKEQQDMLDGKYGKVFENHGNVILWKQSNNIKML